jgi:hypothetical protein
MDELIDSMINNWFKYIKTNKIMTNEWDKYNTNYNFWFKFKKLWN